MENRNKNELTKNNLPECNEELLDTPLYDYGNFKLKFLADKIKSQTYKPKPKMLYL